MKNENALIRDYLRKNQISNISIVSPHLDDAAFSLASFITNRYIPGLDVFTVFTESTKTDSHWSNAMGFENPAEEFSARRNEDIQAMMALDVSYTHAGYEADNYDSECANTIVTSLLGSKVAEQTLLLLPAGAGGSINSLEKLRRRIFRTPIGCVAHQEHLLIRDSIYKAVTDPTVTLGFYAEIPYQWANSKQSLKENLEKHYQQHYKCFTVTPDIEKKLSVAKCYSSQFVAEFGTKPYYQKRTIGIPELILLPE